MAGNSVIGFEDVVAKSENFVESSVDEETILMNLHEGNFSSLKSTGRRIWQLLDSPQQVATICSSLQEEFLVEKQQCESQTLAFLERLHAEGFIEVRR